MGINVTYVLWPDLTVSLGVSVGVSVGVSADVSVGLSTGVTVDLSVDVSAGAAVGVYVGRSANLSVGPSVGAAVDVSVGLSVDTPVGLSAVPRLSVQIAVESAVEIAVELAMASAKGLHGIPWHSVEAHGMTMESRGRSTVARGVVRGCRWKAVEVAAECHGGPWTLPRCSAKSLPPKHKPRTFHAGHRRRRSRPSLSLAPCPIF